MPLFGKDNSFYDLLQAQAVSAHHAAETLQQQVRDLGRSAEYARKLQDIEHEADALTHQLSNRADSTFVTPLDKEDLHGLSNVLDDVTDFIEAAGARIALYQLTTSRPDLEPLVALLVAATEATQEAVGGLRDMGKFQFQPVFERIENIENQSDTLFREALATLLNAPDADAIQVIKWKEIYDRVEKAVDKCETVVNVLEGVVIKYA